MKNVAGIRNPMIISQIQCLFYFIVLGGAVVSTVATQQGGHGFDSI